MHADDTEQTTKQRWLKLCFQSMLPRGSHSWPLIKLKKILLKQFSEAISKYFKNLKMESATASFH